MKIEVNEENKIVLFGVETCRRLSQGTSFQRGINSLEIMLEIMSEDNNELADSYGLEGAERKRFLNELKNERLNFIKQSPPPGIDLDAINAFFD